MIFSLIGMSGSGKSYWSQKLALQGFIRFCADDLIEEKLSNELKILGYKGIQDVSKWMGQPYDAHYTQTSKLYVELEQEVMHEIFEKVKKIHQRPVIIDTTGSIIYTGHAIIQKLKKLTKILYIKLTHDLTVGDLSTEGLNFPRPYGRGFSLFQT